MPPLHRDHVAFGPVTLKGGKLTFRTAGALLAQDAKRAQASGRDFTVSLSEPDKLTEMMGRNGWTGDNVLASPGNWKFMLYGVALILMMRLRPEGLLPAKEVQAELHHDDAGKTSQGAA